MVCAKPVQHAAQQNKPQVKFRELRFLLVRTAKIKKGRRDRRPAREEKGEGVISRLFSSWWSSW
jgi:hypothetical protein